MVTYKIIMNNGNFYYYSSTLEKYSGFLEYVSSIDFLKVYEYANETVFLSTKNICEIIPCRE